MKQHPTPTEPLCDQPPPRARYLDRRYASNQKGGTTIREDVQDWAEHQRRLCSPDGYRPASCEHCGCTKLHGDGFLAELAAFLNFAFNTRDLVALWLVGLPSLHRRLQMQQHAALATRIIAPCQLLPRLERAAFVAMIEDAFRLAGATRTLLSEPAMELLFRACRGLPRLASNLLRVALRLADARAQTFLDDAVITAAITDLRLELPTVPAPPTTKPRSQTGTRSRA